MSNSVMDNTQTTNEELDLAPQPTFSEIRTILQTIDDHAYDVIDSNQLMKELKSEGFACQYCSKVLATKYSLQMHTRLHTGEKPHQCTLCDGRFSHPTDLRRHMLKHTGEKPYMCDVCGAKFTQSGSLKGHSKLHQGEKPHKCTECEESFVSLGLLKSHSRIHNNPKTFRCTCCEQTFDDVKQVVEHCKLFHTTPVDMEQNNGHNHNQVDEGATDAMSEQQLVEEKRFSTSVDISTILVSKKSNKKKCLCQQCGRLLSSAYALRLHNRVHNGERPFSCDQCDFKSSCQSGLKRHYRKHTGEKPFKCETCGKSFARSSTLNVHNKRTHEDNTPQSCKDCGDVLANRSVLLKHWFSKHRSKEQPFFCSNCFETFIDSDTLQQHKSELHALEDQLKCTQCGMEFTRMSNLRRHEAKSCHGKAHTCEECQETFCRRSGLTQHLRMVHGVPLCFGCDLCDKRFEGRYKLKQHKVQEHHLTAEKGGVGESKKSDVDTKCYNCEICQRKLTSKYSLERHWKTHEKPHTEIACSFCPGIVFRTKKDLRLHDKDIHKKVMLKCYLCKELFENKHLLTQHKDTVHRNKCPECNRTFRTKPLLYAHVTMRHKKIVRCSFTCKACGGYFFSKSVYTNHLKIQHGSDRVNPEDDNKIDTVTNRNLESETGGNIYASNGESDALRTVQKPTKVEEISSCSYQQQQIGAANKFLRVSHSHVEGLPGKTHRKSSERPFECPVCGSAFKTQRYLRTHKKIHTSKRPHKCIECGSAFKFPAHLRKHLKMHTDVKPYICDICGTGFRASYTLMIHKRSHTGEKPYECQHCAYRFRCLSDLKRHMVTHDRVERFRCAECSRGFFTKARLNRHLRLHNGDKRYACEMCGERFIRNTLLTYHKCKEHGIGADQLTCGICKKMLSTKHNLLKHMQSQHSEDLSATDEPQGNSFIQHESEAISIVHDDFKTNIKQHNDENGTFSDTTVCLPLEEPIELAVIRSDEKLFLD